MIVQETPMDLIIGRDSIKEYQLFEKIPSQLKDVTVVDGTKQCECQPKCGLKRLSPTSESEILYNTDCIPVL